MTDIKLGNLALTIKTLESVLGGSADLNRFPPRVCDVMVLEAVDYKGIHFGDDACAPCQSVSAALAVAAQKKCEPLRMLELAVGDIASRLKFGRWKSAADVTEADIATAISLAVTRIWRDRNPDGK